MQTLPKECLSETKAFQAYYWDSCSKKSSNPEIWTDNFLHNYWVYIMLSKAAEKPKNSQTRGQVSVPNKSAP